MPDVLLIQTESGKVRLRVEIERLDPKAALLAIMNALSELPQQRKERKDKGIKRVPKIVEQEQKAA